MVPHHPQFCSLSRIDAAGSSTHGTSEAICAQSGSGKTSSSLNGSSHRRGMSEGVSNASRLDVSTVTGNRQHCDGQSAAMRQYSRQASRPLGLSAGIESYSPAGLAVSPSGGS